eukprot:5517826-Prymnesium_polylepis.1
MSAGCHAACAPRAVQSGSAGRGAVVSARRDLPFGFGKEGEILEWKIAQNRACVRVRALSRDGCVVCDATCRCLCTITSRCTAGRVGRRACVSSAGRRLYILGQAGRSPYATAHSRGGPLATAMRRGAGCVSAGSRVSFTGRLRRFGLESFV